MVKMGLRGLHVLILLIYFMLCEAFVHVDNLTGRSNGGHTNKLTYGWKALENSQHRLKAQEEDYFSWLSQKIERKSRPKAIKLPRLRIDRDFAVLLMRSSYAVADEMDFIPMDEFQKQFFLYRADEYELYLEENRGVTQGDLADPVYFDFISFAQYATLSRFMKNPPGQVFVEKRGAEGEDFVIQRPQEYADNKVLPIVHAQLVGDRMLEYLSTEKYEKLAPKVPEKPSVETLLSGIVQAVGLMKLNSFMLDFQVKPVSPKEIEVRLQGPASLWSQQVLRGQQTVLTNDFEAKLICAYLRKCGVKPVYRTSFTKTEVVHSFSINI